MSPHPTSIPSSEPTPVFDLDDCLWSPEMYTLYAKPSLPVEGDLNPDFAIEDNAEREIGVVSATVHYYYRC